MEIRSVALALVLVANGAAVPAVARGQASEPLRIVRGSVPAPTRVIRTAVWRQTVDLHTDSAGGNALLERATVMAQSGGVVAFRHGGHMCAFDEASGRLRWCGADGVDPVALGDVLAYSSAGAITAVGLRDGSPRWRSVLRAHASAEFDGQSVPAQRLFAGRNSVLAMRRGGSGPSREATVGEIDRHGHVMWQARRDGGFGRPVLVAGFAIWPLSVDGAITTTHQLVVRLGSDGGIRGEFGNFDDVAAVRGPKVALTGGYRQTEAEDYTLAPWMVLADVRRDVKNAAYDFEPDYDDNRARLTASYALDFAHAGGKTVSVDDRFAYVRVGRRYYRYRLDAPAAGQHPRSVASDGEWVGGPYHGTLYVRGDDGVHALRFADDAVRDDLVTAPHGKTSAVGIAGDTIYFAFWDGTLLGVDARSGRTVLAASGCPGTLGAIAASAAHVFFVCPSAPQRVEGARELQSFAARPYGRAGGTVLAFPRPGAG